MMNGVHLNKTARYGSFDLKKIDYHSSADRGDDTKQLRNADRKIADLESRLSHLEKGGGTASSSSLNTDAITHAVQAYQIQLLAKLKTIREALVAEVGDIGKIKEEKDLAVAENSKLKKDIERLKYRIHILIKSLNEEEAKNATSVTASSNTTIASPK